MINCNYNTYHIIVEVRLKLSSLKNPFYSEKLARTAQSFCLCGRWVMSVVAGKPHI